MHEFLAWSRLAFRTLHGLPRDEQTIAPSEDAQALVLRWARRHRMLGLLQAGLPEAGTALQSAAYGQARHATRYAIEAERVFARLSPVLSTLALAKGPALAVQAWPDPGLRSFDDLDFLCARQDYLRLLEGMQTAGYAPEIEDPRRLAHLWHYGWGITFRHPDGFMVEMNHRFFPPHYPWPCQLDARRVGPFIEQTLDTATVRAPSPALHLLLCCQHAVWHGWARLAWLADIAGLLVRHPGIFPQAEILAARCPFAWQALMAGCNVAEAIFGPELTKPRLPGASEAVVGETVAFFAGTARTLRGRDLRNFHEQFMTASEKALYRLRRICTPGDGDFRRISLSAALRGLYWVLRPVRAVFSGESGN